MLQSISRAAARTRWRRHAQAQLYRYALATADASHQQYPLAAMQNGESLLGFAADEEVLQSGHDLFYGHLQTIGTLSVELKNQAKRFRTTEYIGVDSSTLAGDQIDVNNAQAVLGLKLTGTTGQLSVEVAADNQLQGFMFHPRGSLLRLDPGAAVASDYLRVEEEEVPRDGIELKRSFNYARDAQGRGLLWIGRSKVTGRGEGSSGLKFDVVSRGKV